MTGLTLTSLQPNGVTTTFAAVIDYRCQPLKSIDVQIGYFIDQAAYMADLPPVFTQYMSLDINQVVSTGNIPLQIYTQLMASGAPLNGGVPV